MPEIDPQEFGAMKAQVEQLKELLTEIRADVKNMQKDWDNAKGGSKVMFAVASILGGFVTYVLNLLIAKGLH